MKRLLLDTHVLLWWLSDSPKLGSNTRAILMDPRNHIYISAASIWEIAIKKGLGKLQAPEDMDSIVEDEGFLKLPVSLYHGDQINTLPDYHKDPFDRMLIVQAQTEGLTLVSADEKVALYPVRQMDPRK